MPVQLTPISLGTGLVALSTVKAYMGIDESDTSKDALLNMLIDSVSRGVEKWCDRKFHSASYVEYFNGSDSWRYSVLRLAQCPIISIDRVATRPVVGIEILNESESVQMASVSSIISGMTLKSTSSGVESTTVLPYATYTTLAALATQINATSGWKATVANEYEAWSPLMLKSFQGALGAKEFAAEFELYTDTLFTFSTSTSDTTASLMGTFPDGWHNIEVRYTAGYSSIPSDVQMGTAAAVKAIYEASRADGQMNSETIGDYKYVRRATEGGYEDAFFSDVKLFLQPYRITRIV
jgi:hypothetical protein